ncbi:AN1-type zinc finger protein 1-like [Photinus pyralis]|uniref:AN1-type domain-containing protein n=1 Tax=Photinus pyralis TaxID=7054 RepID=A0A1Y1JRJ9_PHOPY|nr:AN1-type zinc finger protein 1-like [Photinus pyralis]
MELPNIGIQCSVSTCKQLDFLPLKCKCGLFFCSDHFNQHSVDCAIDIANKPNLEASPASYLCSQPLCTTRSYIPLLCEKCSQHFCIAHRHLGTCVPKSSDELTAELDKFTAPVKQFNEIKKKLDIQLNNNLEEAKKKEKSQSLANKVQLMRIKNKATGLKSIPATDRVYFNVQLPTTAKLKEMPVFVSKIWTLGRVIDAVAEEGKLTNKNNQSNLPQLRLFLKSSREVVSSNLGVTMQELLFNGAIVDGDNLIIEYVKEECTILAQ